MRRTSSASVFAFLLSFVPGESGAQESRDSSRTDSTGKQLKTITVSGSRGFGITGGASAVEVKPMELRSSPAPLLDQALRESPFVHARLNSRGETELSIRGSDSRQAAVLVDGVPVTIGWDHRTDPSIMSIAGADRLVIVRGLGSLLNGPNTLGGTIEVTHDPLASNGGYVNAGVGVDEVGSLVGTIGGGNRSAVGGGTLSLRGGIAHRQRDGYTVPGKFTDPTSIDGLRTNSDLLETDGFVSARWSSPIGRSVGFTVSALDAEKGVPPEEHITSPRLWRYPYHHRTVSSLSVSTGTFGTPFGYGSLDIGFGYNAGRLKIESYTDRDYATIAAEELGDERTTTARALVRHSAGRATVRAGLTLADVKYEETLPPASPANYQQKLSSFGLELETPLGERLRIAGGFVFDRSNTPKTGGREPPQEKFENPGWRFGLTHTLSDAWQLHASATRRSRFPALRELYSGALNRFTPNPDLQPETLSGIEAGVTMERSLGPIPRATLMVAGFNNRLDDAVVRITLQNPTRFMRVNRDRIESSGLELLAGLVFGDSAERSVTLTGDATLQRITIFDETASDAARHAENNPEQRGRLELGVPVPLRFRGFATLRHVGVQYCLNADTGGEMKLGSATTMDFGVERRFIVRERGAFRWLRAVLALDNAGNTAVYDQCGLPQPGRTLRLMMTIG